MVGSSWPFRRARLRALAAAGQAHAHRPAAVGGANRVGFLFAELAREQGLGFFAEVGEGAEVALVGQRGLRDHAQCCNADLELLRLRLGGVSAFARQLTSRGASRVAACAAMDQPPVRRLRRHAM